MSRPRRTFRPTTLALLLLVAAAAGGQTSVWRERRVGAWLREGKAQPGDAVLAERGQAAPIVVSRREPENVQVAARFLAADIERIVGRRPAILATRPRSGAAIELKTRRDDPRWEAYSVRAAGGGLVVEGSNPRGTAFGVYALSEGIGIDPLYLWTGYTPRRRARLVVAQGTHASGPPTFRYRGLFHDDEDILPRPRDPRNGTPYIRGTVPRRWYERYFETALRLRMNMVAPYTRAKRTFEVQKLASDWGLYYTSHHYDIMLSNPYGWQNFELAKRRGVPGKYDWYANREGVLRYWRGGLEENASLEAIYPVGLRGTDDVPYPFPKNATVADRAKVYEDAINLQVAMLRERLPKEKQIFTLTLYNEMLDNYRLGAMKLPEDVIVVWDDNGDGVMRALPDRSDGRKQGIYYHLSFFGATTKQSVHTVPPARVAREFRRIVDAGATEYGLVNVSELRDFVMETRAIAEIMWNAPAALAGPDPARDFVDWWSREYFGTERAAATYRDYYALVDKSTRVWDGSNKVRDALVQLMKKFNGEEYEPVDATLRAETRQRLRRYQAAIARAVATMRSLPPERAQFFFESAMLGMLMDYRPSQAADLLAQALDADGLEETRRLVNLAMAPLASLEREILRAERPPFEGWYQPTWIRSPDFFNGWSDMNPRRPIEMMRRFLRGIGEVDAESANKPRRAGPKAS